MALRIELLNVVPLVWRRVLVSNQWTLASLHRYLQWVMGWTDTHAHEFEVGASVVAPDWWIHESRLDEDASYALFLEILGDPTLEEHEDLVRWTGGVFDPKGFDLNRLNREYKGSRGRRR